MKKIIVIECEEDEYKEIIKTNERRRTLAILSVIRITELLDAIKEACWEPENEEET